MLEERRRKKALRREEEADGTWKSVGLKDTFEKAYRPYNRYTNTHTRFRRRGGRGLGFTRKRNSTKRNVVYSYWDPHTPDCFLYFYSLKSYFDTCHPLRSSSQYETQKLQFCHFLKFVNNNNRNKILKKYHWSFLYFIHSFIHPFFLSNFF